MKKYINKKSVTIFLIIVLIVTGALFLFPRKKKEEIKLLNLPTFYNKQTRNFRIGDNVNIVNELKIDTNSSLTNKYYRTKGVSGGSFDVASIKLGLNQKSHNTYTGKFVWRSEDRNSPNEMSFDYKTQILQVLYPTGFAYTDVEDKNMYSYLESFFELDLVDANLVDTEVDAQYNFKMLTFKANFKEKPFYFGDAESAIASISLSKDKITSILLRPVLSNISDGEKMNVIKTVNSDNASLLYYSIDHIIENVSVIKSHVGVEEMPSGNITVLLKQYSNAFYYFYDEKNDIAYILPSLDIISNYEGANGKRGSFRIVVVNQDNNN